jgi:hypothetical protein
MFIDFKSILYKPKNILYFYSREAHSKLKCWWKNKFKHKITFNKKSFRLKYVILLLNILINNINV